MVAKVGHVDIPRDQTQSAQSQRIIPDPTCKGKLNLAADRRRDLVMRRALGRDFAEICSTTADRALEIPENPLDRDNPPKRTGPLADTQIGLIGSALPVARPVRAAAGSARRQAMVRRWSPALAAVLLSAWSVAPSTARRPEAEVDRRRGAAAYHPPLDPPAQPMAAATDPVPAPPELTGPQPVDAFIRRALAENRTVQAAYHNVQSLRHRVPQVMTLDDPVASNTIFPIPRVGPQYSLMGYNPYNLTLAQQFPWCGTLRLRGEAAEKDVQVALAELAAAQLDTVAAVKRAYFNLYAALRAEEILAENRKILEDFREIARERLATGGTQQDVLRSEVLISELDRELANNTQAIAAARSALARQVHVSPEADFRTLPELSLAGVPTEFDRLYQLAVAARPELQGRLAAVARDEKAVELARKRFYPNVTLGLTYMDMEKTNAQTPKTASGVPQRRPLRRLQPAGLPRQVPRRGLRGPAAHPRRRQALRGPAGRDRRRDPGRHGAGQDPAGRPRPCSATASCPAPGSRSTWPGATTPRATSITRRSSRPCGRCSRSGSRSPRSRPSWARPSRPWSGPSAPRSTSTRPTPATRTGTGPPPRCPALRRHGSRGCRSHRHAHAGGGGRQEARRLPERVAEARRHHAHAARAGHRLHAAPGIRRASRRPRTAKPPRPFPMPPDIDGHPAGRRGEAERRPTRPHRRGPARLEGEAAAPAHPVGHEAAELARVGDAGPPIPARSRRRSSPRRSPQRSTFPGHRRLRPGRLRDEEGRRPNKTVPTRNAS